MSSIRTHHGSPQRGRLAHRLALSLACLPASQALAQPSPPSAAANPGGPRYLLTAPLYSGNPDDPFAMAPAPVQTSATSVSSSTPPMAYSFVDLSKYVHGYVSAGVATQGGHDFSGGVSLPLVLDKVDLIVSGSSGQQGGYLPAYPGGKKGVLHYDTYNVGLLLHPSDDVTAYIGISGGSYKLPFGYGAPYAYSGNYPGAWGNSPWH